MILFFSGIMSKDKVPQNRRWYIITTVLITIIVILSITIFLLQNNSLEPNVNLFVISKNIEKCETSIVFAIVNTNNLPAMTEYAIFFGGEIVEKRTVLVGPQDQTIESSTFKYESCLGDNEMIDSEKIQVNIISVKLV